MGDLSSSSASVVSTEVVPEMASPTSLQETMRIEVNTRMKGTLNRDTKFIAECLMPTTYGDYKLRSYTHNSKKRSVDPIVLIAGDVRGKENVLVRVHDQCFTSEVFGSMRCDCREQLQQSLRAIHKEGGVIIYLQQEGRGIGLANKIAAYSLQDEGFDTVTANEHLGFKDELREYDAVPEVLADLGIQSIRLITNNPFKINQLTALGVNIVERVSIEIPPNPYNIDYLVSKRDKMAHMLHKDLKVESIDDAVTHRGGNSVADGTSKSTPAEPSPPAVYLENRGYAFGRASVEAALVAIREGKVVVVVDDEDRENEGDLIMAAELATPETVGFIVRHSSGVLCVSLESERLDALKLPPMVVNNEDPKQTAYTVSVDYKHGTTTGISSADRAAAFRALASPATHAEDLQRPGHVFPLRYRKGGVLVRAGHTEASLDLSRLAGLQPCGVLAEIVNDDGSLARLPTLREFAATHGLVLTSVQDIIAYRYETEQVSRQSSSYDQSPPLPPAAPSFSP